MLACKFNNPTIPDVGPAIDLRFHWHCHCPTGSSVLFCRSELTKKHRHSWREKAYRQSRCRKVIPTLKVSRVLSLKSQVAEVLQPRLCYPPISFSSAFGGIDLWPVFTRTIERCFFRVQRSSDCGARADGSRFFGSLYPVPGPRTSFRIAE